MREDGGRTRDAEQKTHIVMWGIRRPKKKSKIAPSVPCLMVGFKSLRLAKVGPLCVKENGSAVPPRYWFPAQRGSN